MKKVLCILLLIALLIGVVGNAAADDKKQQEHKSIAIVFDNSSSMYKGDENSERAWCRATYAMEVVASMMEKGDTIAIYPMHPITIESAVYSRTNPAIINGPEEAENIRKIYTPQAGNTPVEAIEEAYRGLMNMPGERWLIVLTDGGTFYKNNKEWPGDETVIELKKRLDEYNQSVNVLYLGIGSDSAMPVIDGDQYQHFSDKASNSAQVLSKLTNLCNIIFGRDTLEIHNGVVDISDLSMQSMVFLVQGKDISDVSVKDASGASIGTKTSERSMKYSTLGSNVGKAVDPNLQGMLVFYDNCKAGNYQIEYSGEATSVVAYYRPDVDLVVKLINNSTGKEITASDAALAGSYSLAFGLIDNQTNDWTESKLLGNTHYKVEYSINGKPLTETSDNKKDKIDVTLKGGDVLDAKISVRYLSGYYLEKFGPDFGWPANGFQIMPNEIDASKLTFKLSGGKEEYLLSELEEQGRYLLSASFDGIPLTGNLLESFVPEVRVSGGNAQVTWKPADDRSGYEILLKYHEDALHTDVGAYTLDCNVVFTDENGLSCSGVDLQSPFTIVGEDHALAVRIETRQSYYQLSKLEVGEPVVVHFTKDGAPLTDEQLNALKIDIDTDLSYDSALLNGESAMELRLLKSEGLSKGLHRIKVHAAGTDEIGQTIEDDDSAVVEIQALPYWVRWLIIGLIILLLILLILFILNQKVLPKKVRNNGETDYNIGGKTIVDIAKVQYNRAGKTLDISAPSAPTFPYVSCAAKLKLEAVSPRRVPSAKRKMAVKEVVASNDITSVEVGASIYELDKTTGKFVKEGNSPTILSNNSVISINGTAQTANGRKKTAMLTQQLRFK